MLPILVTIRNFSNRFRARHIKDEKSGNLTKDADTNMSDFYKLLGLKTKQPSEDELKKAYKKAAMKHHPDRNLNTAENPTRQEAAEKRFKRVAEAYAVLSDPQKKHIYDQYGEEGLSNAPPPPSSGGGGGMPAGFGGDMPGGFSFGGPGGGGQQFVFQSSGGGGGGGLGGVDPHDLFAQLFGQMGGQEDGFGGGGSPFGGFDMMGGRGGGMPRGRQQRRARPSAKPDEVQHDLKCTLEELYAGTTKKLKVTRELLDAQTGSALQAQKVLQIDVKAGWKPGTKVRYSGEGDERPGKAPQDVVFVVKQKLHPYFVRQGDDLHYAASLTAGQASKGVKVTVPTLDGRKVKVEQPAGIRNNTTAVLKGEGMPTKNGDRGDLVVNFKVASAA